MDASAPRYLTTRDCVVRFVKGLNNHFRRGVYDPSGIEGWVNLFFRTNGIVNDAVSFALKFFQPRTKFKTTTGVLGTMDEKTRREIIKAIRRDGYYVFPDLIPEDITGPIQSYMRETPGRMVPKPSTGTGYAVCDPEKPEAATYYFQPRNLPAAQALMTDENFLALATEYIGTDPILDIAQSWLSVPFGGGPVSASAQLYHFDLSHLRWLKIFVYLNDVDTDNGPHCLVRGTHKPWDFAGAKLRRRGQVRIPDDEIIATYGKDREDEFVGPRGTVFIADTRAFHKGKAPTSGERFLYQLYYVNSSYGLPTQKYPVETPTPEYLATAKEHPRLLVCFPPAG